MGVRGLLSTCLDGQDECTETVDLIEVARRQNGIELLVDFDAFELQILYKFWKGLSRLRGNDYLWILGGEYASLNEYVQKLVEDLKSSGIFLVFYIDGAKGSSTETLHQKLDTWKKRHNQAMHKLSDILRVLRGGSNIKDLPLETNIRPVALEDQFMAALRYCECEIHQSPAGEADLLLIKALKERPKAYAILSNDSDFCVFKESKFIPAKLFDLENDLQLGEPIELPEKPERLKVKVIQTEKVMAMLELNNHQLLVEMCIVAGNDFTGPFMFDGLSENLDMAGDGKICIQNYAEWIRRYETIQNHPALAAEMHKNQKFCQAVYYSRNFYNLRVQPDATPKKGYLSQLIEEGIRDGRYPAVIMGIYNNFYWYRMLLEDNRYGQPSAECALTELRVHIYRIVLPQDENHVEEYGRSPYEKLGKAAIMAADDSLAPPIYEIQPDKIFQNLRTFHSIMCHQETRNNTPNWFKMYGRKKGFTVHLLRYFLLLNWGKNLNLTDKEYLALVAMVLDMSNESYYQGIVLKPTVRCVTIGNWFQDLYRYGYSMLGSLLNIKDEFPQPWEIFSGSVWAVMYMVCQDSTLNIAANQVPMDCLRKAQKEMKSIIRKNKHIIRHIVEGFFPFDDR